jgi:hypothetical protein
VCMCVYTHTHTQHHATHTHTHNTMHTCIHTCAQDLERQIQDLKAKCEAIEKRESEAKIRKKSALHSDMTE